jgi:hypothetical protein
VGQRSALGVPRPGAGPVQHGELHNNPNPVLVSRLPIISGVAKNALDRRAMRDTHPLSAALVSVP